MTRGTVWAGTAGLAIAMAAALGAQAPALDVKMGLWETTATIEAAGETHTAVNKSCMTRDKLEQELFMNSPEPGQTCKQALITNTRTALAATLSCIGERPMTGQIRIDALSPTSVKGTVNYSTSRRGGPMTIKMAMTAKWLGADCGSEK